MRTSLQNLNIESTENPIPELLELLGEPVVYIQWPKGKKATKKLWGHLTVAHMTPEYLAELPRGNIGVALGSVSGGLCAIDCDTDAIAESFVHLNPHLKGTLQTHGARGRVYWVRFKGDYPKAIKKLKTTTGDELGEFRSDGGQSIIWGIHPDTHQPYQIVVRGKAMVIEFNSIVWPPEIATKPTIKECTEGTEELRIQKTIRPEETDELKSSALGASLPFHSCIVTVEDALRASMPSKKGENNGRLFNLARAILTLEKKGGRFDLPKLEGLFERWYSQAAAFLREGQTKEEYWIEFMNACQRAKFPLGGAKVAEAWEQAKSQPLPAEAMKFTDPEMRLLIALLKQLQAQQGEEPFWLTSRDGAALLGQKTHTKVAMWLGALVKLEYIRIAKHGNEREATRYHYIWKQAEDQKQENNCNKL